jgi:hypothetical protein
MELVAKSLDEITSDICDVYDAFIAPKRIYRGNNNKLYLFFRACSAGIKVILDVVLALRARFDPLRCSDGDLYSVAKLVGTDFLKGSGSAVRITVENTSDTDAKTLLAGVYHYNSITGMVFSFNLLTDAVLAPGAFNSITAVSRDKGSYPVADNASITVYRLDGYPIDEYFAFSSEDNSGYLGYEDEDALSFRQRILSDVDRQDHIKELETSIRNLPNIFECGLKFNPDTLPVEYDGVTLAPMELLITITGLPSEEMAELVVSHVPYSTHQVDPDNVVYYRSDLYVNGKYPVYFRYHGKTDFALEIMYQYSSRKMKKELVEAAFNKALNGYRNSVTHVGMITEPDIYARLAALSLPNVVALDVNLMEDDTQVPYVSIPTTRTPNLTGVEYTSIDLDGEE